MEVPYYTLAKPREDAAGLWTARLELDVPTPREEMLRRVGEFAISTQNVHALITGYFEGDQDISHVNAVVLARDPHSQERFATLSPPEYEHLAEEFAGRYDMRKVPYYMTNEFRVILGREPGYGDGVARPMWQLAQIACNREKFAITPRGVFLFRALSG